jgi:hypothetical protein
MGFKQLIGGVEPEFAPAFFLPEEKKRTVLNKTREQ